MPTTKTINVQWKNTDACLDFTCECGQYHHYDGFHANAFICGTCDRHWFFDWAVPVAEVAPDFKGLAFERWDVNDD